MSRKEAYQEFRALCLAVRPSVFVVLGSGLGSLIQRVGRKTSLRFADIPGLPVPTIEGHKGCLTLAEWAGRAVLFGEGRLHFYEGHPWEAVVRPIQLAAALGVKIALLTNAAGGIRDDLEAGSIMPIRDHLEWNQPHPGRQPRSPSPYSPRLVSVLQKAGTVCNLAMSAGVYAAVSGPCYETPAEIRALRTMGADAVGMSTSREVQAGVQAGLECAALSLITNRAAGLSASQIDHGDVLTMGKAMAERVADWLEVVMDRVV